MKTPDWLATLADKTRAADWSLGSVFDDYRRLEDCGDDALAADLSCTPEAVRWMAVCRRPREESFAADVRAVAERFGASPTRLASLIRRVDATRALQTGNDDRARLLAARDREEGDE